VVTLSMTPWSRRQEACPELVEEALEFCAIAAAHLERFAGTQHMQRLTNIDSQCTHSSRKVPQRSVQCGANTGCLVPQCGQSRRPRGGIGILATFPNELP